MSSGTGCTLPRGADRPYNSGTRFDEKQRALILKSSWENGRTFSPRVESSETLLRNGTRTTTLTCVAARGNASALLERASTRGHASHGPAWARATLAQCGGGPKVSTAVDLHVHCAGTTVGFLRQTILETKIKHLRTEPAFLSNNQIAAQVKLTVTALFWMTLEYAKHCCCQRGHRRMKQAFMLDQGYT